MYVTEQCSLCGFPHEVLKLPGMTAPRDPRECIQALSARLTILATYVGAFLAKEQQSAGIVCPFCSETISIAGLKQRAIVEKFVAHLGSLDCTKKDTEKPS